jgi:hypothetical protein
MTKASNVMTKQAVVMTKDRVVIHLRVTAERKTSWAAMTRKAGISLSEVITRAMDGGGVPMMKAPPGSSEKPWPTISPKAAAEISSYSQQVILGTRPPALPLRVLARSSQGCLLKPSTRICFCPSVTPQLRLPIPAYYN